MRKATTGLLASGLAFVGIIALFSATMQAMQTASAKLGRAVNISAGDGPIEQVWAHADPSNARYLIICGNQYDPSVSDLLSGYVYVSADGGSTWSRTLRDNSGRWVSEESCTYGVSGHTYYAAGVADFTHGVGKEFDFGHLHIYASDDHGMTWKAPWVRPKGWVDWTYLQTVPIADGLEKVVVFANNANNGPGRHWVKARPVALESTDGARSFSDVVISSQPQGCKFLGTFAGGSVVLSNGTTLFSATAELTKPNTFAFGTATAAVFAFSPLKQTLTYRSFVRTPPFSGGAASGAAPPLAQDVSGGSFHGRLYSVGVEIDRRNTPGYMWLATSNDRGYHWSSKIILRGSTADSLSSAQIAVNNAGILGIVWTDSNSNLFFASSADGGRTFGTTSTIARLPATNDDLIASSAEAVAWDEDWLSETLDEWVYGRHTEGLTSVDFSHLGLSIRMSTGQGMGDSRIVADVSGVFHVFWAQPDAQNNNRLLTRTVEVRKSSVAATTPSLEIPQTQSGPPPSFAAELKLPTPGVARWSAQRFAITGQQDISSSISLDFKKPHYDASSHMIAVDVTLINTGHRMIRGPISFIGFDMHSDFGMPHAINARGWMHGWPYWDATPLLPAGGLQPKSRSAPLYLEFQVSNFKPLPAVPLMHLSGNIVAMHVGIYQKSLTLRSPAVVR